MPYVLNDKVTLAASRGGWSGFVCEVLNGPGGAKPLYRVHSASLGSIDEGVAVVAEDDISAGPLTAPVFSVNDKITLYGLPGTITAANADDSFDVEIDWNPNQHMTLTRSHASVPLWRLAIENTGA
jgi:hypothetical protein